MMSHSYQQKLKIGRLNMKTNNTERLSSISIDTGLSISEAERYLKSNLIGFDKKTLRYYVLKEKE